MNRNLAIAVFLLISGCKACNGKPPEPLPQPRPVPVNTTPDVTTKPSAEGYVFKRVHFKFDSTEPTPETLGAIRENVAVMQAFPDLRVEIQGHADERGTTEYNIALGERRAYAIRDQMTRMGITATRISVVSYGEERPLSTGATESAFSQNRRAEFRVLTSEGVKGTVP